MTTSASKPPSFEQSAKITQRIHIVMEYTRERSTLLCGICGQVLEAQAAWLEKPNPLPSVESFGFFLKHHPCFAVKDDRGNVLP